MGTWKNRNEDGRSHFRFVLNGQKSDCKIHEVMNVPISGISITPLWCDSIKMAPFVHYHTWIIPTITIHGFMVHPTTSRHNLRISIVLWHIRWENSVFFSQNVLKMSIFHTISEIFSRFFAVLGCWHSKENSFFSEPCFPRTFHFIKGKIFVSDPASPQNPNKSHKKCSFFM